MSLPSFVWRICGTRPGPTVTIIGGTHGDEPLGGVLVDRLRGVFGFGGQENERVSDKINGTLVLLYGNPAALRQKTRAAQGSRDLNRWFQPEEIERVSSPKDSEDLRRAREIAPLLAASNFVLDLHSTSSDTPPFLCATDPNPLHRSLVTAFDVGRFLVDPDHLLARDLDLTDPGTTDRWVSRHGGCGICYETGRQDDASRAETAWDSVRRFLVTTGVVKDECVRELFGLPPATHLQPDFFALTDNVASKEDGFSYAPGHDQGWVPIMKGELIGTYPSGSTVLSPASGLLVFPRAARLVKAGENLFYIAQRL